MFVSKWSRLELCGLTTVRAREEVNKRQAPGPENPGVKKQRTMYRCYLICVSSAAYFFRKKVRKMSRMLTRQEIDERKAKADKAAARLKKQRDEIRAAERLLEKSEEKRKRDQDIRNGIEIMQRSRNIRMYSYQITDGMTLYDYLLDILSDDADSDPD